MFTSCQMVLGPLPQTTYSRQELPSSICSKGFCQSLHQKMHSSGCTSYTTDMNSRPYFSNDCHASPSVLPRLHPLLGTGPDNMRNLTSYKSSARKTEKSTKRTALSAETNPVGVLQERFQSKGLAPIYELIEMEGSSHCPKFCYQVKVSGRSAKGEGASKKEAKRAAAKALLDVLDGGNQVVEEGTSNSFKVEKSYSKDPISVLQETCIKYGFPMPVYESGVDSLNQSNRTYDMKCRVGSVLVSCIGSQKKDVKRKLASSMLEKLKALPALSDCYNSVSDLAHDLDALNLESPYSQAKMVRDRELQSFYTSLQRLNLLSKGALSHPRDDYSHLLETVVADSGRRVTFTDLDERYDSELQCMVEFFGDNWTLAPISYGHGTDIEKARNDAARTFLSSLKIMSTRAMENKVVDNGSA